MRLSIVVLTGSLILMVQALFAQEAWTLQKCIDHALENNLQVKQQDLNIELSESSLTQSKLDRLPSLNADGSHSYNYGRSIDPTTNLFATEKIRGNQFSLSSNLVLFNGMQKYHSIKQSEFNLMADQFSNEKARNDIVLNVTSAYLQILLSEEQAATSKEQLKVTQDQIDQTQKLVNAGVLPEGNLLELQAQLANDELNVVVAANAVEQALLNLKLILRLGIGEKMAIAKPEIKVPDGGILTNMQIEQVYQAAEGRLPQIKSAEFNQKSAESSLQIAKGAQSPTLSVFGALRTNASSIQQTITDEVVLYPQIGYLSTDNTPVISATPVTIPILEPKPFADQLSDNFSQAIGFSLRIPIFNQWQVRTSIEQAKIGVMSANYTTELAKDQLKNEVLIAYTNAKAASQRYKAAEKSVTAMSKSFEYVEQRYTLGLVNALDYNIAKNNKARADSEFIQAKYDYVFKLKILDFYQGNPITIE